MAFDPTVLRGLRKDRGVMLKEISARMGISIPQIQRLEKGQRRLTVDMLMQYCDVLDVDVVDLLRTRPRVPIIGTVDNDCEILPLTPNTPHEARAPHIVSDPKRLAAVRWAGGGRYPFMQGHILFFYADIDDVPELAWSNRCVIGRVGGTLRIGWLFKQNDQIHINDTQGEVEFDVDIEWASPIVAQIPPFLAE